MLFLFAIAPIQLACYAVLELSKKHMKSEAEANGAGEDFKSLGRELKVIKWSLGAAAISMYGLAWWFWAKDRQARDPYVLLGMFIATFLAVTIWESWIYLKFVRRFQHFLTLKPALFYLAANVIYNCSVLALIILLFQE